MLEIVVIYGSSAIIGIIALKLLWNTLSVFWPDLTNRTYSTSHARLSPYLRVATTPIATLKKLCHRLESTFIYPYLRLLAAFILNRVFLIFTATVLYVLLEDKSLSITEHFRNIWHRWDTNSYMIIAEHGYPREGDVFILVFYPLFPWLTQLMQPIVGDYFYAGMIVSNLLLLLSCYYLYRLAKHEFSSEKVALHTVLLLLFFPYSFFASMAYTEGTFLFFSIACFYYIRRENWLLAGLLGMGAALTRNQGVILFAPMVYEAVRTHLLITRAGQPIRWQQGLLRYLPCLLIPLGTLIYLWINKEVSGNWFQFIEYQRVNWHQQAAFFAENVFSIIQRFDFNSPALTIGTWLPSVLTYAVFIFLVLAVSFKLPTAYSLYTVAFFIISYTPSWLLSGQRYVFVLFPVYLVLAKLLEHHPGIRVIVYQVLTALTVIVLVSFLKGQVF